MIVEELDDLLPAPRASSPSVQLSIPASGINGDPMAAQLIESVANDLNNNPNVARYSLDVDRTTGAFGAVVTGTDGSVGTYQNPIPGYVEIKMFTPTTPENRDAAIAWQRAQTTQADAARAVGSHQPHVSRLENPENE